MKKYFTSESVTEGHPDKLCDAISDSILDAYLTIDADARVAVETVASKGEIYITGEVSAKEEVDIEAIARKVIQEVGYDDANTGIDYRTCKIMVNISKQSEDIALGVNQCMEEKEGGLFSSEGAGDQGMMFGFACTETPELMPLPISLAHKLSRQLTFVRKEKILPYLKPDGKTQVTVEYEDMVPKRVDTIVLSTQHEANIDMKKLKEDVLKEVIQKVIPSYLIDENTKYFINPTGRFVIGGPLGDSGLTGRKIIVDTYGGYARHGGGAFSGKDPTKVDRSASYMARHLAKNVVANGLANQCEIQISYAIGVAKPISLYVDTFGTNTIPEEEIATILQENFDLTPRGIIQYLDLKKPIYQKTTNYGHFGKEELSWEKIVNFIDIC